MQVKEVALTILSRIFSAIKFIFCAAVLITVPLFTYYYSFVIDCSGYFQGDLEMRSVVDMILSGENIIGYEQLNARERDIVQIIASDMNPAPDTIALGSSRILQLTQETARSENFFNFGVTGGDVADVMGIFYLFDKLDKMPQTVIIGLDPWHLRSGIFDARSDKELYFELLNEELGYNVIYESEDDSAAYEALYSPQYFQDNISFSLRDESGVAGPQVVQGDLYDQSTEVKVSDGSLLYDVNFRSRTADERLLDAMYQINNLLYMTGYPEMDTELLDQFDKFFEYASQKDVEIKIVLSPYHPATYEGIVALNAQDPTMYGGFLQTEAAIRELAQKYGISVYGSYNPSAIEGVTADNFYDGLHCDTDALEKSLWGYTTPDGSSIPQQDTEQA